MSNPTIRGVGTWANRDRGGRTEDEYVIYPYFSPDENINCDHKREKYWDKEGSINDEESAPNRDIGSSSWLET